MIRSCQKNQSGKKQNGIRSGSKIRCGNRTPLSVASIGPPLDAMRFASASASVVPVPGYACIYLFYLFKY
jgi:hypothetical protein